MLISGIAWGIYSFRGKNALSPVSLTTTNFVRTIPMAVVASAIALSFVHLEVTGIILALISGILTSGLGYILWYKALQRLTTTKAAIVQLLVPLLAAFGGVMFLAEQVSTRLAIATVLILGGVAIAVLNRTSKVEAIAADSTLK